MKKKKPVTEAMLILAVHEQYLEFRKLARMLSDTVMLHFGYGGRGDIPFVDGDSVHLIMDALSLPENCTKIPRLTTLPIPKVLLNFDRFDCFGRSCEFYSYALIDNLLTNENLTRKNIYEALNYFEQVKELWEKEKAKQAKRKAKNR